MVMIYTIRSQLPPLPSFSSFRHKVFLGALMLRLSMVLLPVVRFCIHELRLVDAVRSESNRRDAEAGESALEAVEACERA